MRIISGKYKGRVIKTIAASSTRPTTDRVREAMASSIISYVGDMLGVSVFDAFAGSGAIGFEMLSRGASHVTFVEANRRALAIIESNATVLDIPQDMISFYGEDVCALARRNTSLRGGPFGLIILDPPYACSGESVCRLLEDLSMGGNLGEDALIVYEHGNNTFSFDDSRLAEGPRASACTGRFDVVLNKRYGITEIDYISYQEEDRR